MNIFVYLCLLPFVLAENQHTYYWRDYRGVIPPDAFGFKNLYVAQVPYHGILPATLYPDKHIAVTEAFGKKLTATEGIKVLCDSSLENFYWDHVNVETLTGDNLSQLVIGGLESNSTLYIARIFAEGEWHIGKVFPPSSPYKGLRTWNFKDEQLAAWDFEILKTKFSPFTSP